MNILIVAGGEQFIIAYNKLEEKLKKKYPNIHLYRIAPLIKYQEELERLKQIKFEILVSLPLFSKLISDILKSFPDIKWMHSLAAGVEKLFKIDIICNNENLIISNSRGAYSESLGEIGITSMLYFSYNIYSYIEKMKSKHWSPNTNNTLNKKNLLIIGYGNNGICLAKRAKAFNMKIIAVKKRTNIDFEGKELIDECYNLDNLPDKIINEADYIYATLPETKETINVFDKKFFKKMNKNSVFINVGRGNAVVENDIVEALENNIIRGALLDVTPTEPLKKESKLYNFSPEKLLITNHSLSINDDTIEKGFEFFYKNFENYLKIGKPLTIVDRNRQY